jgi:hypothetical protein
VVTGTPWMVVFAAAAEDDLVLIKAQPTRHPSLE